MEGEAGWDAGRVGPCRFRRTGQGQGVKASVGLGVGCGKLYLGCGAVQVCNALCAVWLCTPVHLSKCCALAYREGCWKDLEGPGHEAQQRKAAQPHAQ